MSESIDRRIGSTGLVVTTLVVAVIVAAGLFALWRFRAPAADRAGQPIPIRNARPDEPLPVTRFLPGAQALAAGPVTVRRMTDTQAQARELLVSLLSPDHRAPVLSELRLRGFFLDGSGTGYVDVTAGGQELKASAWDELLALYAVVDTLTQNFEEIRQVRFLVDGREAQTLAGHIDLGRALTRRMDLVRQ